MPAKMIHMVETHCDSISYGINFIHVDNLRRAADAFKYEVTALSGSEEGANECYPDFPLLAFHHLKMLKRSVANSFNW